MVNLKVTPWLYINSLGPGLFLTGFRICYPKCRSQTYGPSYWVSKLRELEKYHVSGLPQKQILFSSWERCPPPCTWRKSILTPVGEGAQRNLKGQSWPRPPFTWHGSLLAITSGHSCILRQPGIKLLRVNTTLGPHFLPVSCKIYVK